MKAEGPSVPKIASWSQKSIVKLGVRLMFPGGAEKVLCVCPGLLESVGFFLHPLVKSLLLIATMTIFLLFKGGAKETTKKGCS